MARSLASKNRKRNFSLCACFAAMAALDLNVAMPLKAQAGGAAQPTADVAMEGR